MGSATVDDKARAAFERLLRIAMIDATTRGALQLHLGLLDRRQPRRIRVSDIFAVDRDIACDIATVVPRLAESPVAEYRAPRRDRGQHRAPGLEVWTRMVDAA